MKYVQPFWKVLCSQTLAVVLILFLLALTFFGTLAQVEHGLYAAQHMYFTSWFVMQPIGGVHLLPLPGGQFVMIILTGNLFCGGILRLAPRLRYPKLIVRTSALLLVHLGIIGLLVAGAVTHRMATEGSILLYEGQETAGFDDYHAWQLNMMIGSGDGHENLHVDTWKIDLYDLPVGSTINHTPSGVQARVEKVAAHGMWVALDSLAADDPDVFMRLPRMALYGGLPPREQEAPTPIIQLAVTFPDGQTETVNVWGGEQGQLMEGVLMPWSHHLPDGRHFGLTLQRVRHPLPFTLRLDEFRAEFHPRTGIAASYESDVSVDPHLDQAEVHRIQMNQPLRRDGYVLFQSSYGPSDAKPGDTMYSIFAVVHNPSDQWPKWMTYVLAIAMSVLFGEQLVKYLLRTTKKNNKAAGGVA
jgi:hypothetical protein